MRRISLPLLALALVSCAQQDASSLDGLRAEIQARFGASPDTLDFQAGVRIRLVYVDTSGRDRLARSKQVAYLEDSLQYDRAFDQALWLWTHVAERDGVDTISVRHLALEGYQGSPLASAEYYFYPKQLENPAERPVLARAAVGPNQSDTVPSRRP